MRRNFWPACPLSWVVKQLNSSGAERGSRVRARWAVSAHGVVLPSPAPKAGTARAGVATCLAPEWEGGKKVVREHVWLPALVTAYTDGESY